MALFTEDQAARIRTGGVQMPVVWRLATPDPVRLWSGDGNIELPQDLIETAGSAGARTYSGAGELLTAPEIAAVLAGQAGRVGFSLPGVPMDALADIAADESIIRFATINMGVLVLDGDLQQLGPTVWLTALTADTIGYQTSTDENGVQTATVTLSAFTGDAGRRRPIAAYYSKTEQRKRSSDDAFCDRVPIYQTEVKRAWPRFGTSAAS